MDKISFKYPYYVGLTKEELEVLTHGINAVTTFLGKQDRRRQVLEALRPRLKVEEGEK